MTERPPITDPDRLRVPYVRVTTTCGHHGPTYACNRPADHGGRHCYSWQNVGHTYLTGIVRGVWP